jgi:hypothetical protein
LFTKIPRKNSYFSDFSDLMISDRLSGSSTTCGAPHTDMASTRNSCSSGCERLMTEIDEMKVLEFHNPNETFFLSHNNKET